MFSDDWEMPARVFDFCGCGAPAREHPRRPAQPAGNYLNPVILPHISRVFYLREVKEEKSISFSIFLFSGVV